MMIYADRTVSQADDQWINTGLSGLSDQTITGLLFHYQTQDIHSATAIRCVRLTEVNSPTTSTPNHIINEQTNLASPATGGPAVYRKMFAPRKINGVLALQLQMMIGGPAPSYFALLGGIGVTLA